MLKPRARTAYTAPSPLNKSPGDNKLASWIDVDRFLSTPSPEKRVSPRGFYVPREATSDLTDEGHSTSSTVAESSGHGCFTNGFDIEIIASREMDTDAQASSPSDETLVDENRRSWTQHVTRAGNGSMQGPSDSHVGGGQENPQQTGTGTADGNEAPTAAASGRPRSWTEELTVSRRASAESFSGTCKTSTRKSLLPVESLVPEAHDSITSAESRGSSSEPDANAPDPGLGRRTSWMQRLSRRGSRESNSGSGTSRSSHFSGSGTSSQNQNPRGSWIQRMTGMRRNSESNSQAAPWEPYIGQEAQALYRHKKLNAFAIFPPDSRTELDLEPGMELDLIEMREDGWCIVRKRPHKKEYYAPGNYITIDGSTPCFVQGQCTYTLADTATLGLPPRSPVLRRNSQENATRTRRYSSA